MSGEIAFGTDGWRDVIADNFTFENVRRVAAAIAAAARTFEPPDDIDRNTLIAGYDRRFLSREFALAAAEVLRDCGYRVIVSDRPTPSQTISFSARNRKVLGGIVITASHNPAKYNGVKFKAWYGGSALPEMYKAIAGNVGRTFLSGRPDKNVRRTPIVEENILDDYLAVEIPEILGSVGCYRIENRGAQLFAEISGDHFCIRGLPLIPLLTALRDFGVIAA